MAPRKDALIQLNINPQERARINALIMASTIAFSSPFGYLAGWLSSLDRRLPFVFMLALVPGGNGDRRTHSGAEAGADGWRCCGWGRRGLRNEVPSSGVL